MKFFQKISFLGLISSSAVFAQVKAPSASNHVTVKESTTLKETCGLNSTQKTFSFYHRASFIKDFVELNFTKNGGFTLYDEDGVNHIWEVDANSLTLSKKYTTRGSQSYAIFNLESSPKTASRGGRNQYNTLDWTGSFEDILHTIVNQENYMEIDPANKDPLDRVQIALNCAHKILINAVTRGQERLLAGKTDTVTFQIHEE